MYKMIVSEDTLSELI